MKEERGKVKMERMKEKGEGKKIWRKEFRRDKGREENTCRKKSNAGEIGNQDWY